MSYVLAPFVGWFMAGSLKFLINTLRVRKLAWGQIGYGGLPSTHSSVVGTTTFLVGFRTGFESPVFGVALTLAFIVIMDALSLRRRIGEYAVALNALGAKRPNEKAFRERMGHSPLEVAAGLATGLGCAYALHLWV